MLTKIALLAVFWTSQTMALSQTARDHSDAHLKNAQQDLPNFLWVDEHYMRSGRPTTAGLDSLLDQYQLAAILNLENRPDPVSQERAWSREHSVSFLNISLDTGTRPQDRDIDAALDFLKSHQNQNALIHCFHGQDRTGLIVGLYRVEVQKWSPQKAYDEMLARGFHCRFRALDQYFRDRVKPFGSVRDVTSCL